MKPFNKKLNFFLLLIFAMSLFLFTALSCDSAEPFNQKAFQFSVLETSCTEAWLKVISNDSETPKLKIKNGEQIIFDGILSTTDTIIYTDSLLPSTNYSFTAELEGNNYKNTSTTQFRTLDTTSHNFTWQMWTLGNETYPNKLNDVAIINENDIWAVGEIHTEDTDQFDSNGVWVQPYNAVHWNGSEWELKRIKVNFRGNKIFPQLEGIFAFTSTDIWMVGSLPIHGDGKNWEMYDLRSSVDPNLSLSKVWGNSSDNMYFVGRSGSIAHYNGSKWKKISSRTELDLYDIYSNNGEKIYASGGDIAHQTGVLLKGNYKSFIIEKEGISGNSDKDLFNPYFLGSLTSVWVSKNNTVYFGGHYLYKYKQGRWGYVESLEGNYIRGNSQAQHWGFITAIAGNSDNDMLFVGERNTIRHFNGVSWKQLGMPYDQFSNISWIGVSVKNNTVVAVGEDGRKAIIMVLKR